MHAKSSKQIWPSTGTPLSSHLISLSLPKLSNLILDHLNLKTACLDVIIEDVRLLANKFLSCSFNFVPRTFNKVANAIAKYALSLDDPLIWQESVPNWICREVVLDVATMSLS